MEFFLIKPIATENPFNVLSMSRVIFSLNIYDIFIL